MNLFRFFAKKEDQNTIRLVKSQTGEWMVKRGFSVLYIGSRDKCETFMKHAVSI